MVETHSGWLKDALDEAIRQNWCVSRNCSTCPSPEMHELLVGRPKQAWECFIRLEALSEERARLVVSEMGLIRDPGNREALMWLLHAIWLRFGERAHASLFPELAGSFAGQVLDDMRAHNRRLRGGDGRP